MSPAGTKAFRLLRTRDFDQVYRHGRRRRSERFVLIAGRSENAQLRFGISVQKRMGDAVVRNRIKRRIREIIRLRRGEWEPRGGWPRQRRGWDVVVQPRTGRIATAEFAALSDELARLIESALKE